MINVELINGPEGCVKDIGNFEWVQQTYNNLRGCIEGDDHENEIDIAFLDEDNVWMLETGVVQKRELHIGPWTDIVFRNGDSMNKYGDLTAAIKAQEADAEEKLFQTILEHAMLWGFPNIFRTIARVHTRLCEDLLPDHQWSTKDLIRVFNSVMEKQP